MRIMGYKVDNAIIMCAGTSSRFAPISYETHKGLIKVKGEILVERQINQLIEAGIKEIILIVGYKKEDFYYLKEKYGVKILYNEEYDSRNNNSSIYVAKDHLKNSYICSVDNYFTENPFSSYEEESFYSAVYSDGRTAEWCLEIEDGYISNVVIGGTNKWYMLGHAFWDENFTKKYIDILENIYNKPETKDMFWETIYINNIDVLKMRIKKYDKNYIYEFDTLDELRTFDSKYINNSNSSIILKVCKILGCNESDLKEFKSLYSENSNKSIGFKFKYNDNEYKYKYKNEKVVKIN